MVAPRPLPQQPLATTIAVPSSKSVALRCMLLASVARGRSTLSNVSFCDDVLALLQIFDRLQVAYERRGSTLSIVGRPWQEVTELPCGESGFLARTVPFLAGVQQTRSYITGRGTLLRRDLSDLTNLFRAAGGTVSTTHSKLPLNFSTLQPTAEIHVPKLDSSQALSGLLMALPLISHATSLTVPLLPSSGYIDTTLQCIEVFGGLTREISSNLLQWEIMPSSYTAQSLAIAGDWSAAGQLMAFLQPSASLTLTNLSATALQPDRAILELLPQIGISYTWQGEALHLQGGEVFRAFYYDATHTPDLFPPLTAIAAIAEGISTIGGLHRLRNKESDRAQALLTMLQQFGIRAWRKDDELCIEGGKPYPNDIIATQHDHRIAMAATAIAQHAPIPVCLDDTECIRKSFPDFLKILFAPI